MLIELRNHVLELDPSGALWWPARAMLIVADLHLEKGAAFARRGRFLPPYDTLATLNRLAEVIAARRPRTVVSLGDAFHDRAGPVELDVASRERLARLVDRQPWVWIAGNHDPELPAALGGTRVDQLALDGLTLRHAPSGTVGEVVGHLHPKARLASRHVRSSRPCFVSDGMLLLLPAFGALTGGLDVHDPAISSLFPRGFTAYLLGETRVFPFADRSLLPRTNTVQHLLT